MIYRLEHDHDNYMSIELPLAAARAVMGDDEQLFGFYNKSYTANWVKPDARFYSYDSARPQMNIADISDAGKPTALVLNARAYEVLQPVLQTFGEFLPVNVEGIEYHIFNVLNFVADDVVDRQQSEAEIFEGEVVGIKKLVFDQQKLGEQLIFKTAFDDYGNVFCQERLKSLIEENGLAGLLFQEKLSVWESDE